MFSYKHESTQKYFLNLPFQLLSIFYAIMILSNFIILTSRTTLSLFDLNLPLNLSYFLPFCESFFIFYLLLTLIEIYWLKIFYKFVWKSVRPLDEGFVVSCLTLNNIVFATLLSIGWLMSGKGKLSLMYVADPFEWHITFWINESLETYFRYYNQLRSKLFTPSEC